MGFKICGWILIVGAIYFFFIAIFSTLDDDKDTAIFTGLLTAFLGFAGWALLHFGSDI